MKINTITINGNTFEISDPAVEPLETTVAQLQEEMESVSADVQTAQQDITQLADTQKNCVLSAEQTLTKEQQAQARANIGAKDPFFIDIVLDGDPYVEGFVFDGAFEFDELVAAVQADKYVALRWDWEGDGVFQLSHISKADKSAVFTRLLDGDYTWVRIEMTEPRPIGWGRETFATDDTLSIWGRAADAYTVGRRLGDIETALDNIIAIQESLIGGASE